MKRELVVLIAAAMGLTACGGGGGSVSTGTNTNTDGEVLSALTTGYSLPTEISAVPADNTNGAAYLARGLSSRLHALARATTDLPATSDYNKAATRKYIEERALEQFDIIEQVMSALAQTNYADQENINAGPYKAMIAWDEEQNGVSIKQLQPWVVESRMIVVDGQDVNRLLAWIEEPDEDNPGQSKLIKAEFKILKTATQNPDGSYADYGEWDLNVKFNDAGSDFFAANARIVNGQTVLKINESQQREEQGQPMTWATKAVMYRSGTEGYGKVEYNDMNCDMNGCAQVTKGAKYAYNAAYLGLQEGADPAIYKDRNGKTDFTHRYGLFYAAAGTDGNGKAIAAGDNLQKHKGFGFPLRYTDSNGVSRHAYYGAWQGRHQLWGGGPGGGGVPADAVLTREDRGPGQTAETYTVSAPFAGTLTKRTLVAGDLSDVLNIAVETFVNKHFDLVYDGSQWQSCNGFVDWSGGPSSPVCRNVDGSTGAFTPFTDFGSLVTSENDRKHVNIGRWDPTANSGAGAQKEYVRLESDPGINGFSFTGAGFYEAMRDNMGRLTPNTPAVAFTPTTGDSIFVDIGGSIYIQYTNAGWVQKKLESFDQQTWTPKFVNGADTTFMPELGRDYYINSNGANFVVRKVASTGTDTSDYEVWIELQSAANPVNHASILPAGTNYLRTPWRPEARYTLNTTVGNANFLKLVYANTDVQTPPMFSAGDAVTSGEWGLRAYSDNGTPSDFSDDYPLRADGVQVTADPFTLPADQRPVEFNWEYSADGGWGTQQFLVDASSNYVILSDPLQITVPSGSAVNASGTAVNKVLSLQFDGWMHGLPDLYQEMSKNNWEMTPDIASKVINIPEGADVTDGNGVHYYVKPLEVSVFLNVVTPTDITNASGSVPDISQADSVDLSTGMPVFVEHNMGALPANTEVKYSEGKAVE